MNNSCRSRRGFTLVELLVVIAIIGILIALLLPAVQAAREAARRTECTNNMKQILLGIHNHHDTFGWLPDGGHDWTLQRTVTGGVPETAPNQSWGFLYQILPFVENENLYMHPDPNFVRNFAVETYFCPSRRAPTIVGGRGLNDYAGNAGMLGGGLNNWGEGDNGGVIVRGDAKRPPSVAARVGRGYKLKFRNITDGTAFTIAVGEKWMGQDEYNASTCSDNEGHSSGWDWDIIRWGNNPPKHDVTNNTSCKYDFGSNHPGGANFALCDGSVRLITYTVDASFFQYACRRDDGQVIEWNK